ncbi:hypothetical protein EV356DRAFT_108050 [Viridothelium virens]|uniref:Tudor domain-containing protein n=1 Tax=Viridothelium virens TaxID=1048519 RepID=A0A6A6HPH8_VIRVR|nr:hypothetical protein EV356DRAFT_108050 [Viridothelium virens]
MDRDVETISAEVKIYKSELEQAEGSLRYDPDNEGQQQLVASYQELIAELEKELAAAEEKEAEKKAQAARRRTTSPPPEKWSKANHPKFQEEIRKAAAAAAPASAEESRGTVAWKVNDIVMARWSGDHKLYQAKITSITGSSSAPKFMVLFLGYGNTDTVELKDIIPLANESKKRKADGSPVMPAGPATPGSSSVISAAADIDPNLANQVRKEPSKLNDGPSKPTKKSRTMKRNKDLESSKSKWQDFQGMKGKQGNKAMKKDSMFRVSDDYNARVGFTGSGKPMRKDAARTRHNYQALEDE